MSTNEKSTNLSVDIELTDKAPSTIKPSTSSNDMTTATIGKGSLTPSNIANDSNKINIYYDYEEDHHYSIKLEDSLYFEEEYHKKSLQDIMKIFQKQAETVTSVEYLIKGIYHFFTNAFAPVTPAAVVAVSNTTEQPQPNTTTTTPNPVDNYHLNNILTFLEKYSGLQLLHHLLITYSDQSVTIANYGCLIIIIFISAMPEMKELLGHLQFCEIITYILQVNIGIAEISEHGLYAVAVMTKRHFANIRRFSKISQSSSNDLSSQTTTTTTAKGGSGKHNPAKPPSPPTTPLPVQTINICELVSQIGIFGCNLRHPRSVYIARNVCLTIGNISEPIFTKSFKNNSILPLLIQLYTLHYKNDKIFIHSFFYSIHRLLLLHPWFFIELIHTYQLLTLLNEMILFYYKNIPILFRLWQVLIHCYQRAYTAFASSSSTSSSSSSLSPRSALSTGNAAKPVNAFELFKEELMKENTHFLLFEKIFIAMNYEQLATTPELIAMKKVVEDLNPSHKNTNASSTSTSYNPHFEWLESHEVCEKYIEFILKVQQYALRADEFETYSGEGKGTTTTNNELNENPPAVEVLNTEKRG